MSTVNNPLDLMGDAGLVIGQTFAQVAIAEDAIASAIENNLSYRHQLWDSFMLLEDAPLLKGVAPAIYRAHCDELLRRVVSDGDLDLGTDAEVLILLSKSSFVAPLMRDAAAAYIRLFEKVLPGQMSRLRASTDTGDADWRREETFDGATEQIISDLRKQIRRTHGRPRKYKAYQEALAPKVTQPVLIEQE